MGQKKTENVQIAEKELQCKVCENKRFWKREAQLNTALATFLGLDWANSTATCYICDGCGYIHWFLPPQL